MSGRSTAGGRLAGRWAALWERLGAASAPDAVFARLAGRYAEPHRAYHTLEHVARCLEHFDAAHELAERPDEVEAAIWLHDVVYDPRAADNEERSADWMDQGFKAGGVGPPVRARIRSMILATKHTVAPSHPDEALVVDIDLAILGAAAPEFNTYQRQIREEYAWLSNEEYERGRRAVLTAFLDRPHVYATDWFRERYEARARENLVSELGTRN